MGKIQVKNVATGKTGDYILESQENGTGTELSVATSSEMITGTATAQIVSPAAITGAQTRTISTAAMGTVRAVHGQVTGSNAAIASGTIAGTRGLCTLSGVNSAGGAYFYGAQGKLIVTGTMNHADSRLCAMIAQLDASGGTLTAGQLSGLWIDIGGITGAGGGQFNAIRITTANGGTPNAIIYSQSDASYLLDLGHPTGDTTSYFAAAGTGAASAGVSTGGVAAKVLKVIVDGTDYWLPLYSSNS